MPSCAAEIDHLGIEVEIDHLRRRVGGVVQHQRDRLRHRMGHGALELGHEIDAGPGRHVAHRRARDDEAEGMDRIARVRHQHDVARRGDRLREVGEAFLRAQVTMTSRLGIELDAEAAPVIGGLGAAQPGDAARGRIAVGARILHRLDQLLDDVLRRRPVGIAHAEIDDVAARRARLRLQGVDFGEDIGRQALDAIEFFGHDGRDSVGWRGRSIAPTWYPFAAGDARGLRQFLAACRRKSRRRTNASASAARPIAVGTSQPARPLAARSPAAPNSTKATVIGNCPSSEPSR